MVYAQLWGCFTLFVGWKSPLNYVGYNRVCKVCIQGVCLKLNDIWDDCKPQKRRTIVVIWNLYKTHRKQVKDWKSIVDKRNNYKNRWSQIKLFCSEDHGLRACAWRTYKQILCDVNIWWNDLRRKRSVTERSVLDLTMAYDSLWSDLRFEVTTLA